MGLASEDLRFLRSLGRALLSLTLSAIVLLVVVIAHYQSRESWRVGPTAGTTIPGRQFTTVMGNTRFDGETLLVTGLKTEGEEAHALVDTHLVFNAEHYPYLRYQFDGLQTGLKLKLFWRKTQNPGQMFAASLPANFGTSSTFHVGAQPEWHGTITDIAIFITGDLRDQPLRIPALTLEPGNWNRLIAAIWSEWTAFRGWAHWSINYLQGTSSQPGSETISPALAMASWAGLALVFLAVIDRLWPMTTLISYGAVILIPWVALDQLWQSELSAQLRETKHLFSDKTTHEKHLVDVDRSLYSYARRLQEELLPSSPSRIFLLHDSVGHNYDRLKIQYYLLPHNIYNFNQWQPDQTIRPGDYILVLGTLPGVSFDATKNLLHWQGVWLTVTLVDSSQNGTLYRVQPTANYSPGQDNQQGEANE